MSNPHYHDSVHHQYMKKAEQTKQLHSMIILRIRTKNQPGSATQGITS